MIYFADIYKKAINLFDDPKITYAYEHNRIMFDKYMYGYFSTVDLQEPVRIAQLLTQVDEPKGQAETFESDGVHNEFTTLLNIPDHSEVRYTENGTVVVGSYNAVTHIVTFEHILPVGQIYMIEYYYPGAYTGDFTSLTTVSESSSNIIKKVTNILARLIVIAWAEETRDMLVDIQNLLKDSDFKATPNSQILTSKTNWVESLLTQNRYDQTKLSWQLRYSSGVARIKRF